MKNKMIAVEIPDKNKGITSSDLSTWPNAIFSGDDDETISLFAKPVIASAKAFGDAQMVMIEAKDVGEETVSISFLYELVMDRYGLLEEIGARNIWNANERKDKYAINPIVAIFHDIDGILADSSLAKRLTKLLQIGRAAGVHILLFVRRPSMANLPKEIIGCCPVRVDVSKEGAKIELP
jgi:hypothetical protein